ncbi:MFS transporter [Afifella sp. IM 167]|uniref:MFS transporter n=1 Tax=Afifella sp. IM 167 TaxID=2033586 RepID=UPI001CCFD2DF|nr:MFS transporter [Afifella sp. IM 167]
MPRPSLSISAATGWRTPAIMLMIMAAAMQIAFASWWTLIKNFAVEGIGLTGREIGFQESIREIPGFLSFLAIYVLFVMREQTLALVSLALLGIGVAITGWFPSAWGLYATTLLMSLGFHYYETMNQSLALQWLPRAEAPRIMGRILAVAGVAQLVAYGLIAIGWKTFELSFTAVFMIAGGTTLAIVLFLVFAFPDFREETPQLKKLVLRRRYWLYYALTFLAGARRQIFTVFAGLMMVQKFGYEVGDIALLFLINCAFNMLFAPKIGAMIVRFGERAALTVEYIGLIGVFLAYAFVENPWLAASLYVVDHAFFAMAIALKTYFQKIAAPADIAPSAGVAFTINHIAAVGIPASFGFIWLVSPSAVFLIGAAMATTSLILVRLIPRHPDEGVEVVWKSRPGLAPAE